MAKISTYPILSTPSLSDLLIGTDVDNLNITKNFAIGDIATFIIGGSYVPYTGATANVNLGAFNITASGFIIPGGLATQFVKANGTLDSTVYQPAGNYITQLSGEATASGPGNATVTLSNAAVIGKVLTGLTITGNAIVATDSILTAFGKVQNQINTLIGGVQYKGTWNAATNTPTLVSSVGVAGHYFVVSVAGNTNLNGITDWNLGDWAIFNGSAWEKVDNTDAVISVNGQIGAVVLTTTNIAEGTNLYYTDVRARLAINLTTTGNSGAATYNSTNGFFNIPNYTLAGLGGVPSTRQITINGVAQDLSVDRTYNVGTVTSVATTAPLTGGTITGAGTLGITQSGVATDGFLSSIDWNTFNNKQNTIVNPVTGTGTAFFLPMWSTVSSLVNSPLSYLSDTFNFQYNSPTGGTVIFTNSGLTAYAYSIQMNNFGSPRSTIHSYTDGIVVQSIAGIQVSRVFANGNTVFGTGVADNGHKLELSGSLFVNTITNATIDTDRFLVSDSGVIKYRTGTELLSDIGAGVGSVTSVGLTMPSAFSVANSPITGSGTLAVTGAGIASQYIRGDGTLADLPTSTGGGASVSYYLNGSVSQGTIGGVAYRELSEVPIFGAGTDISIAADGYVASFLTDAGDPNLLNIPAGNWNFETYFSASSAGGTPSFYVELYRYDGTTFTLIASSVGVPELISFGTAIQPYFSTLAVPQTALAATDRLAIRYFVNVSGRTIILHTENGHLCQIVTTFSNGLTALNGLTDQVQFFQVGTAGADFNISSVSPIHTFNIPSASAINRGVLSSADYITFNSKQGVITLTTTGTSGAATFVSNTLNIPNYAQDLSGFVTLNTAQNITAAKGFINSGGGTCISVSHTSGSGIALDITKAGNNEALKVTKSSGSGNAMTVIGGNFEAPTIVKTGGTSSQFLKADGSVDSSTYVTTDTTQSITGFKTIVRTGDVLNFKIGVDTLYGLKICYNQNELVPSGEATWSFQNTFNNGIGTGLTTTPISFFRGVLVTGERLLSVSVNANLLDYYGNNPSGRYPIYAYNTGVQQFASSIIVGETNGVVNPATGAIADLPAGAVANFKGRVIGSNALNNNDFVTLGQVISGGFLSLSAIGSTPNANGATITGAVLNLQPASASFGGVVTTGTQTLAGEKTFATGIVINTPSAGISILSNGRSSDSLNQIRFNSNVGTLNNFITSTPSSLIIASQGNTPIEFITNNTAVGTPRMTISGAGAVTLTGTLGGTSALFSSTVTASSLIKTGGTSSQFLMADGSVNTSVLASGAYLPLAGGTLTGALNGTSAVFSGAVGVGQGSTGAVNIGGTTPSINAASFLRLQGSNTAQNYEISVNQYVANSISITPSTSPGGTTYTTPILTMSSVTGLSVTGAATFSSSVTASKDGAGNLNTNTTGSNLILTRTAGGAEILGFRNTGSSNGIGGTGFTAQIISDGNNAVELYTVGGSPVIFGTSATERMRITSVGKVGIGTATPINNSKLTVTGAIAFNNNTDSALASNEFGQAYSRKTTVVGGGSATSIKSSLGPEASIILVCGRGPTGSRFADLVLVIGQATTTPLVIGSRTYLSAPSRTYTNGGENLQLQITGDSDTYNVFITGIGGNELT